ncbi:MAG TPA: ribokinase, partial [Desulfotomaculum sp.]|nr:ribokinase [Desulfotomaculum sp.]
MDLVATVERAPAAGETLLGDSFHRTGGGKGANQAVAAARLGAAVEMVGKVGSDPFGRERLQGLRAERVGTRSVTVEPGVPTGVALITLEKSGENRIIVVPGANARLSPADVARAASLSLFDWAQVVLVQLEIPLATVAAVLEQATKHSVPVVLNPAPAPAEPFPASWWSQISVLVPNRSEAALLSGVPTDTPGGVEKAARTLLARGVRQVVVTAGREGAFVLSSEETDDPARTTGGEWIPAFPVEPVDTVGAGDTFCAALATGLAAGETLVSAARFAAAAAAIAVTRPGAGASAPTRAEVQQFLESGRELEALGEPAAG